MTSIFGKSALIGAALMAFSCLADGAPCEAGSMDKVIDGAEIQGSSVLAAVLQFGYERGVCLGIEAPALEALQTPMRVQVARTTTREVLQTLLGATSYQISEKEGVIVLRSLDAGTTFTQLDATVPEFKLSRSSLAVAETKLFMEIKLSLDPSIKGFVGDMPGDPQLQIGLVEQYGHSARDVLTIIAGQVGGSWVSGLCPVTGPNSVKKCWTVIPYGTSPEVFRNTVSLRAAELLKERASQK
jgi:hypothetical protein